MGCGGEVGATTVDHVVTPRGVCGRDKEGMNMIRRDKVGSGPRWDISLSQTRRTNTHTCTDADSVFFFFSHLLFFNQLHLHSPDV